MLNHSLFSGDVTWGLKFCSRSAALKIRILVNMCTVERICRSTTWSYLVAVLVFSSVLDLTSAQLYLFVSKEDATNYLSKYFSFEKGEKSKNIPHHVDKKKSIKICCSIAELDFQEKLYLIQAGLPATMLKNPTAFHDFMAPIEPSTSELRISWFSLPQVSETWLQRWGIL